MKIFVIGATGRTGREVVEQALARGHDVTAFVRSPEAIGLTNERLAVIKGEATEEDQLVKAMQNHDAVVSTLGPRKPFEPIGAANPNNILSCIERLTFILQ